MGRRDLRRPRRRHERRGQRAVRSVEMPAAMAGWAKSAAARRMGGATLRCGGRAGSRRTSRHADRRAPSLSWRRSSARRPLAQLGRHPDRLGPRAARSGPPRPRAITTLRLESPVRAFARLRRRRTGHGGTVIPAGDRVLVMCRREPRRRRYPDPDQFDVTREARTTSAAIPRRCCAGGPHLAELEMQSLLRAAVAWDGSVRDPIRVQQRVLRGYRRFRVSFRSEPRRPAELSSRLCAGKGRAPAGSRATTPGISRAAADRTARPRGRLRTASSSGSRRGEGTAAGVDTATDVAYWFFTPLVTRKRRRSRSGIALVAVALPTASPSTDRISKRSSRRAADSPRGRAWRDDRIPAPCGSDRVRDAPLAWPSLAAPGVANRRGEAGSRRCPRPSGERCARPRRAGRPARAGRLRSADARRRRADPLLGSSCTRTCRGASVRSASRSRAQLFHRWHPRRRGARAERNWSASFLDVFGTFHMPRGRQPMVFGIPDGDVPAGIWRQLWYPFARRPRTA